MILRRICVSEARLIREQVLQAGQPAASSIYPGDDAPDTLHLGAFENGQLAGVATVCREPIPIKPDVGQWRLRGMAIVEGFQRKGLGKQLAEHCVAHAAEQEATSIWCSARMATVPFYRSLGFTEQGESFRLPE